MIDKIILSKDRRSAVVHFDTHSITLSSDKDIVALLFEMIIEPSILLSKMAEMEECDTTEINIDVLKIQ